MATLASIGINITGDSKELSAAIASATAKMESFAQKAGDIGKTLSTRLTLPIVGAGALMVKSFTVQEDAVARLTAGLRANGGQAGVTSGEIIKLAQSLQKVTTFGDEATISAAALLTTFHQIRNEVGAGNDVFNRTIIAAQDLASAMGTDLQSATMQLAKALENPTIGLGALSRTGTTFTEQQKAMIKTLVESGRTLEAQKMILDVVESQYKGTAQTIAQTTSGQIKRAFNELGDEMEEFGRIIAESLIPLLEGMTKAVRAVSAMDESTKRFIVTIAALAAAIGPVLVGVSLLTKGLIALKAAALAHPYVALAAALVAVGTAAYSALRGVRDLNAEMKRQAGIEGELTGSKEEQAKLYAKIIELSRQLAREQANLNTLGMDSVEDRIRAEKRIETLRSQIVATTRLMNESQKLAQANGQASRTAPVTLESVQTTQHLSGSINELKERIKLLREEFDATADASRRFVLGEKIQEATRQLDEMESALKEINLDMDALTGRPDLNALPMSIADVNAQLAEYNRLLDEATTQDERNRILSLITALTELRNSYMGIDDATRTGKTSMQELSIEFVLARQLAESFTSSFGAGLANVIVQGDKLTDVLKNIGKLLLSSAIQQGLRLLLLGTAGFGIAGGTTGIIGSLFGGAAASPIAGSALSMDGAFKLQGTDLVLAINRSERTFR